MGEIYDEDDEDELRLGDPNLPIVREVEGGIVVDFVRLMGSPAVADYCFLPMTRKRNYLAMAGRVTEHLLPLVEQVDGFGLELLSLHLETRYFNDDPDYIVDEVDLAKRTSRVFNKGAVDKISELVDAAYVAGGIDIDEGRPGGNDELQFTNEHAKIILKWAWACLAATPIVTAYLEDRDIPAKDSTGVILEVYGGLLRLFEDPAKTDISTKIHKLIESRINRTSYSDKVMWSYLQSVATTPKTFADVVFRRFVIDIIPKLMQGTNVVSFFHSFVRNQIRYLFVTKFAISYRPIKANAMDSDGVGAQERLETELIRRDEGAAVLADVNARQAIREMCREVGMVADRRSPEVQHWIRQLREHGINPWQRGMITKIFLPMFGRVENVRTRSLEEYAIMLAATLRWLELRQLNIIRAYMAARVEDSPPDRRITPRRKFIKELIDSASWREILGTTYLPSQQAIVDSGVVINMINTMHGNDFVSLPEFGDEEGGGTKLEFRQEAIAQEVLRLVAMVARGRES